MWLFHQAKWSQVSDCSSDYWHSCEWWEDRKKQPTNKSFKFTGNTDTFVLQDHKRLDLINSTKEAQCRRSTCHSISYLFFINKSLIWAVIVLEHKTQLMFCDWFLIPKTFFLKVHRLNQRASQHHRCFPRKATSSCSLKTLYARQQLAGGGEESRRAGEGVSDLPPQGVLGKSRATFDFASSYFSFLIFIAVSLSARKEADWLVGSSIINH